MIGKLANCHEGMPVNKLSYRYYLLDLPARKSVKWGGDVPLDINLPHKRAL